MAYARGIDVSHHQGTFDWAGAKSKHDLSFAFAKATEGQGWRDSEFKRNWQQMRSHGLVRGAYHFARPGGNVINNVTNFLSAIDEAGGLENDDLVVLDLETTDDVPSADVGSWARIWCAEVAARTDKKPIIYTGYWFIEGGTRHLRVQGLGEYPLWIAYWPDRGVWWPEGQEPRVPEPWKSAGSTWTFWQHSDSSNVLDLNVFNGSPTQLREFAANQPETGDEGMLPCRYGDRSEAVEYWQRVLAQLGYYGGEYDGVFGDATKAAIDKARQALGLAPDTRVSPYLAMRLHMWLFSRPGPKGDKGDPGPPGKDGQDGKTPTEVTVMLTGRVTNVA